MGPRAHPLLLLVLCALLFFYGLGRLGLTDRDEGSNAEAAREMLQSGDWITPTLNGAPRFAKPALTYWLIEGAYRVFGVSEFSARLPSAVFATGLILMQYYFARRFLGPVTALRAAAMLLLNFEILAIGRMVLTDMVLIFFTTLSIFAFFLGLYGQGSAKRWYWVFYIAMGLATLTKGPVGLLVPLLAVIPYILWTRPWRSGNQVLRDCHPFAGTLVLLAVAVPWYSAMFILHGKGYLASAQGDTVTRFFSVLEGHGGTILFYIPILFFGFFPWSGYLPAALLASFRTTRTEPLSESQALAVLSSVWILGVFLFFTISSTRLPHYIAPLFPGAALLVSMWWDRLQADEGWMGKLSLMLTLVLGGCLGLAFIGVDWAYDHFIAQIVQEFPTANQIEPGWAPMAIGFLILAGMGFFGYAVMEGSPALSFTLASLLMVVVAGLTLVVALPRFNQYFIAPAQELAAIAGLNLDPNDTLIAYGRPKPSLLFYAKRDCSLVKPCIEVIKPGEEEKMQPLLKRSGQIMILTQERLRSRLPAGASNYQLALGRHGYVLLAKKPTF
jgi:4-amino-4-deoxy-L-arabinose transferase-like glycosyltransferase